MDVYRELVRAAELQTCLGFDDLWKGRDETVYTRDKERWEQVFSFLNLIEAGLWEWEACRRLDGGIETDLTKIKNEVLKKSDEICIQNIGGRVEITVVYRWYRICYTRDELIVPGESCRWLGLSADMKKRSKFWWEL